MEQQNLDGTLDVLAAGDVQPDLRATKLDL